MLLEDCASDDLFDDFVSVSELILFSDDIEEYLLLLDESRLKIELILLAILEILQADINGTNKIKNNNFCFFMPILKHIYR